MTITAGLSATKTGFELIKSLREALGKPEVNPGDIQARLVELQFLMLDAQRSLADADEENRQLKVQNQDLKRMSSLGEEFVFEEGVYWRERSPYCPICWDTNRKPVRLSGPTSAAVVGLPGRMEWICALHKAPFAISRNKSVAVTSQVGS